MGVRDFTLADTIRRNAEIFPERPAFVFDGKRTTHGEYLRRVEALAGGLAAEGLGQGDRLAILAYNNLEFAELYGAAAWLGAIMLPVNGRLALEEIEYVLNDGAPKIVVADVEHHNRLAKIQHRLPSVERWYVLGKAEPPFRAFEELMHGTAPAPQADAGSASGYVIFYTAAVDGRPRGALLSHGGLVAASLQLARLWTLNERDVNLGALPLFHLAGLGMLLAMQQAGGATVIMSRFDASAAARLVESERVTVFAEFAPMLRSLLDEAAESRRDLSSLRIVTGLDAPETIERFEAACKEATFWVAYGQSELSGFVTASPYRERPGSAGRPIPLMRLAVVDEFDQELPTGRVGAIVARGPMVFSGYWNRQAENALVFRNGWHHTGDMGRFDEGGYLFYEGPSSAKELIKPGGENVYPFEVEKVLREHPAIAEAVVIGVPDEQWGEAVKAVCVCRPGKTVTPSELIDFVAARIARYKKPKHVDLIDAMPKTPSGLIDRAKIKEVHGGA